MFSVFILILCTLLIVFYLYVRKRNQYWKERGVPTVDTNFVFGKDVDFMLGHRSLEEINEDIYWSKPNEPYIGTYNVLQPVLFLRDPEMIHQIAVKDFNYFPIRQKPLTGGGRLIYNVTMLAGDEWKTVRSTLITTFAGSKMRKMFGLIEESAELLVEEYLRPFAKTGLPVDVKETMARFALDVIGKCAFGLQFNTFKDSFALHQRVRETLGNSGFKNTLRLFIQFLEPRLLNLLGMKITSDEVENFFFDLLRCAEESRRNEPHHRGDFLQLMLDIKDEDNNKAQHLFTENHIASNMFIFYFAGHETTSITLTFALYELALQPEIQEKLRQEIIKSKEANMGVLDYSTIKKIAYLDMVISETLRLHGPTSFTSRICTETYQLPGSSLVLRPGDQVIYSFSAMHKDEKYFHEPLKFNPDRFSEKNKVQINPLTYIPFGSGPRICLGVRFAKMETKICLAAVLSRFRLSYCDKTERPVVLKKGGFFHSPQNEVWLMVEEIE